MGTVTIEEDDKKVKCCEEWEVGIEKIIRPAMNAFARNPQHYPQNENGVHQVYDGPQFKFCPWCGTLLMEKPNEN